MFHGMLLGQVGLDGAGFAGASVPFVSPWDGEAVVMSSTIAVMREIDPKWIVVDLVSFRCLLRVRLVSEAEKRLHGAQLLGCGEGLDGDDREAAILLADGIDNVELAVVFVSVGV